MFRTKSRTALYCVGLALVFGAISPLSGQVQLYSGSATNAASYIPVEFPNGGVTRGGMFIVTGNHLGSCGTTLVSKFPISTTMNGTSMKVTVGGTSVDVPMIYVVACRTGSNDQLAGIVPSNTPTGTGTLTVSYNGSSAAIPITVVDRGFGFFTLNQGGTGAAVIHNYNSPTDWVVNTLATPAKPGQTEIAWGTGLGPDGNSDVNAPVAGDIPIDLELYVGGQRASVSYKGRSGCCSGVDQIVFQVPSGVQGCYVPVVAKIGKMVSNFTTMSVSPDGGVCSDPNGLTQADIINAQQNNKLVYGILEMVRTDSLLSFGAGTGPVARLDDFYGVITEMPYSTFLGLALREVSTPGSCLAWRDQHFDGLAGIDDNPVFPANNFFTLNAGTVSITTPSRVITADAVSGRYDVPMGGAGYIDPPIQGVPVMGDSVLDPGTFRVSSTGGSTPPDRPTLGGISGQITIPKQPTFTNRFSMDQIDRNNPNGATVTWSDADPNALIEIRGYSVNADAVNSAVGFYCVERGSAGKFTVPPAVLLSLPAAPTGGVGMNMAIAVGISGTARFTGAGVDVGFLRYNLLYGKNSIYK